MRLTTLRGLVVPWVFLRGDYDAYLQRLCRVRVRRLLGPLWLVVIQLRAWQGWAQYRHHVLEELTRYARIRAEAVPGGGYCIVCESLVDGCYIGTPEDLLMRLRWGVRYFFPRRAGAVACIGYDPGRRKWHGWSHRARGIFATAGEAEAFAESVS